MSSELFDAEDRQGVSVSLEMNVHNTLFLTAMGVEERDRGELGEDMVTFAFRPDDKGLSAARRLRDALNEWVRHVEEDPK